MSLLNARGTGPWTCPLKSECTKGGASNNFQRNSDYKYSIRLPLSVNRLLTISTGTTCKNILRTSGAIGRGVPSGILGKII